MRGAGAWRQGKSQKSFILGWSLPGDPCRIGGWKRVRSCKAGPLDPPSWSRCEACWRPIRIGAGIGSRANCAGSGTGAASRAKSRTWRPARCCSVKGVKPYFCPKAVSLKMSGVVRLNHAPAIANRISRRGLSWSHPAAASRFKAIH